MNNTLMNNWAYLIDDVCPGQIQDPVHVCLIVTIRFRMSIITHRDRRGRDLMVVRFTTTCHGKVHSIKLYVINVASDLRQVGGFLPVLRFPPLRKLTATI